MPDPRRIVEKADIAVSNLQSTGGYLNPIQASTFIRMVQEQPTMMNDVRMVPMNAPTMEINKIGFTSRVLRAAPSSGTALTATDRSAPTTEKVTLATSELIAEVHIPYDVLEDNIERGGLESTIMALLAERVSLDLEELLISGDTGSSDAFLATQSGILKLTVSHVVDYTADPVTVIDKSIFKALIKAMPNKYMRNRAAMRTYISPNAETEYADWLSNRQTDLGDTRIGADYRGQLAPFGVPIKAAALMPNSKGIFTWPKNLIVGIQRQIMIESDRDIRARVLIVVVTLRIAIQIEEEDAVVKVDGLAPDGVTTTTV